MTLARSLAVAAAAAIALAACGPSGPKLRVQPKDAHMVTQVGKKEPNGELVTTGKAGALFFGPYIRWPAGKYKLVVKGQGPDGAGAWIDVTAQKGSKRFVKVDLKPGASSGGTIASTEFSLDEQVEDLEVRMWVEAATRASVTSYEISAAK